MKRNKILIISLLLFPIFIYLGMFFGDLGGVGGYDNIASRWLYEEVMFGETYSWLFAFSEFVSPIFLMFGLVTLVLAFFLTVYSLAKQLREKFRV